MVKYIIKDRLSGDFIGVDKSSGGYPTYNRDVDSAKIWYTQEEANEYKKVMSASNWELYEITYNFSKIEWHDKEFEEYLRLKDKYKNR